MIVVADTSVILNLCRVRHERLLQQIFTRVLIPTEVAAEFTRLAGGQARFAGLVLPDWIEVLVATHTTLPAAVVEAKLDLGESAANALCLAQRADALLMDESLGRAVAARLGLRAIGILGVLIQARRRQLIASVAVALDQLERDAGFWITPALRQQAQTLAGESSA